MSSARLTGASSFPNAIKARMKTLLEVDDPCDLRKQDSGKGDFYFIEKCAYGLWADAVLKVLRREGLPRE